MLEGGTKVDAFIYSWLIDSEYRGKNFSNLMHVSDWMPTILELADITYESTLPFDGVSQVSAWEGGDVVRNNMVYNMYTNSRVYDFDMWTTGSLAVRNERYNDNVIVQSVIGYGIWYIYYCCITDRGGKLVFCFRYKLIHFYNGTYAQWHEYFTEQADDDELDTTDSDCNYADYADGDFVVSHFYNPLLPCMLHYATYRSSAAVFILFCCIGVHFSMLCTICTRIPTRLTTCTTAMTTTFQTYK
jgi:hypothetical protein